MPTTVDHGVRRAAIAEALVRIAVAEGLHAVTMRSVAAEAGVSLRQVQYYFGTKASLMDAALRHVEEQSHHRMARRLAALPTKPSLRTYIETFFLEALPTNRQSRSFHIVWTSFAMLAEMEQEYSGHKIADGPARLENLLFSKLQEAQKAGEIPATRNAQCDAATIIALNHGLGTGVLIGLHSPNEALAIFSRYLDELFQRPIAERS